MSEGQLLPHARQFVDAFLAAGAPRVQALVAPVQSGAGAAIEATALHVAIGGGRVLIVVPAAALGLQSCHRLREQSAGRFRVSFVDTAAFRERVAMAGNAAFGEPGVYVAVAGLIAGPALDVSLSTSWSLVVFDSIVIGSSRAVAVEAFLRAESVARVLIRAPSPRGIAADVPTIQWRHEDLRDAMGRRLFRDVKTRVATFRSDVDELALRRDVASMSERRASFGALFRASASSPAALEAALVRRASRGDSEEGASDESLRSSVLFSAVSADMAHLLDRVDELDRDSKLDAAVELVSHAVQDAARVVVLTVYVATARYLHAALADRGLDVVRMSGDVALHELHARMRSFRERGGVLVATVSMLRGWELQDVDMVLHYDWPLSPADYYARVSRFLRGRSEQPLDSVLLRDELEVQPSDEELVSGLHDVERLEQ